MKVYTVYGRGLKIQFKHTHMSEKIGTASTIRVDHKRIYVFMSTEPDL